jgi:hypothetical protein
MKQENVNRKSGPHSSLQSQSGEVREVQFLAERGCPHCSAGRECEPFPVWVEWPAIQVSPCGGRGFRVTREGQDDMLARGWQFQEQGARHAVCEHMGRLIE